MSVRYIDELTRDFRLEVDKAALILVDLQYASGSRHHGLGRHLDAQGRLAEAAYRFDRIEQCVLPNTARLLKGFRQVGARVIYLTLGAELPDYADAPLALRGFFEATNNHAGTREHEIIDEIAPLAGEPVLNKTTQGAFASTGMNSLLRSLGVEQLVMVGVSTNNCVETTAREAVDRGYAALMVADATGTCSEAFQTVTLQGFRRLWGRVATTDEVLAEIGATEAPGALSA